MGLRHEAFRQEYSAQEVVGQPLSILDMVAREGRSTYRMHVDARKTSEPYS